MVAPRDFFTVAGASIQTVPGNRNQGQLCATGSHSRATRSDADAGCAGAGAFEWISRIEKTLEDPNLKLGIVASDVVGASGRAMLEAIAKGETDAATLAQMARGSL